MIVILAALLLLSSCSDIKKTDDTLNTSENEVSSTESIEETDSETTEATPAPTAEPETFDMSTVAERSLNGLLQSKDIPEDTTQLIVVVVDGNYDKMYLMEKQENGMWQVAYGPFDVQLGENGLGKEQEGDGKSPEGLYELGYAFGEGDAPVGTIWPWRTSEDGDLWIEDSNSKYYNMFVQEESIEDADWKNYSNINIAAFARAVEIRYNSDRVSGVGSAIFLHIWISPKRDTNG